MKLKRIISDLLIPSIKLGAIKTKDSRLRKLELLIGIAQFIPHPMVRTLTRTATTGILFYQHIQRLKKPKK